MAPLQVDVPVLLELVRSKTEVNSLKRLLIKYILENLGDYLNGKQTLEKLPTTLREMVLRQMMQLQCHDNLGDQQENIERLIQAYSQLVSPETKKIELGGFISFCCEETIVLNITKILEVISQKASGLENLDFYKNSLLQWFQHPCLENNSIGAILKMENLKIIHLPCVKYIHVKLVCKNLEQLQYLNCARIEFAEDDDIEADITDFKSSFSRLRVFLFNVSPFSTSAKLRKQCIQHLPKLEIVNDFADSTRNFPHQPELAIPEETSSLRHLFAAPTTFDLPAAFPNVTHLKAHCSKDELRDQCDSILRFANIESLMLPYASPLHFFLKAYGANLQTLIMTSSRCWQKYSFKQIFDACPKLQRLEMYNVQFSDDKKPIESFSQLRELHLTLGHFVEHNIVLTNILAAPNLEKFSLSCYLEELDIDDLRKLMSLIADEKILCTLTSFNLRLSRTIDYRKINYDLLRSLRDFVAVAAAYLPNLIDFTLGLSCRNREDGFTISLRSNQEKQLCAIGDRFHEWVGDNSIAKYIRAINARNKL